MLTQHDVLHSRQDMRAAILINQLPGLARKSDYYTTEGKSTANIRSLSNSSERQQMRKLQKYRSARFLKRDKSGAAIAANNFFKSIN